MLKYKSLAIVFMALLVMTLSCNKNQDNESAYWNEVLDKYSQDESVTSLILVKCTEGSNAEVAYYLRKDSKWELNDTCFGHIGKNGLGKEKEGDAKSPIGEFNARCAFGILPNPGTVLDYIDLKESTFACDEDCEYYNQIIDTVGTGHRCTGEDMSKIAPSYNYGISLDYNKDNVYPLGSNIFFHCEGNSPYTSGCVAVNEPFIKHILETCGKSPKFCINKK